MTRKEFIKKFILGLLIMFAWILFFTELYFFASMTTVFAYALLFIGCGLIIFFIGPLIFRRIGILGIIGLVIGIIFAVAFSITSVDAYQTIKHGQIGPISINKVLDYKNYKIFEFDDAIARHDLARGTYTKSLLTNVCKQYHTVAIPVVSEDWDVDQPIKVLFGTQWATDCFLPGENQQTLSFMANEFEQATLFTHGIKVLDYEKKNYLRAFNQANELADEKFDLDPNVLVLRSDNITKLNFTIMKILGFWGPLAAYVISALIYILIKSKKK